MNSLKSKQISKEEKVTVRYHLDSISLETAKSLSRKSIKAAIKQDKAILEVHKILKG